MGLVVALCYVILILHMGKTRLVLPALAAHLCATELQTWVLAPDPDLFPAGSIFIPKQVGLGGLREYSAFLAEEIWVPPSASINLLA